MQTTVAASREVASAPAPQVLIAAPGWHIPRTAEALDKRGALAGIWVAGRRKRFTQFPADKVRCCEVFHLALMPFYLWTPQIWSERIFYAMRSEEHTSELQSLRH